PRGGINPAARQMPGRGRRKPPSLRLILFKLGRLCGRYRIYLLSRLESGRGWRIMAKWQSTGSLIRLKPWLRRLTCGAVILSTLTGGNGCTRSFFRKQADKEVDCVLAE